MNIMHRSRVALLGLGLLFVSLPVLFGGVVSAGNKPGSGQRVELRDGPTLNGGGSSFAKLEIDQWRAETARNPFNLSINYVAQGSSFGRQQYIAGNLDFAASDIPFQPAELPGLNATNRKSFVYVPVSAGGLGFMYNLIDASGNKVTNLNLTRSAVCRMFTEVDMMWNDPEIQNANPSIVLPAEYVRPIVRSDGSGTSYVLSEFCITLQNGVWTNFVNNRAAVDTGLDPEFVAGHPTSNWPQGWGKSGAALAADGVAAAVADSSGLYAVTYNEAGFAKIRGFPNANVENGAGQFTQPTEEAVSVALGYAQGQPDGTFKLNFTGTDPAAYFPSTYSYVIAQTTGFSADKGLVLAKFLCYAVTKGQRVDLTTKLAYARLSAPLVDLARAAIAQIPGAPPWDQCKVDSAPPPAAVTTSTTTAPAVTTASTAPASGSTAVTAAPTTSIVVDPQTGSSVVVTAPAQQQPGSGTGTGTATGTGTGTGGSSSSGSNSGSGSGSGAGSGSGSSGGSAGSGSGTASDDGSASGVTSPAQITDCIDPVTGLPADPTACVSSDAAVAAGPTGSDDPTSDGSTGGATAGDASSAGAVPAGVVAAPVAQNLPVSTKDDGVDNAKVIWWLLQGFSVCAIGVALSGARKRAS